MKKLICVLLALVTLFSFAACSSSGDVEVPEGMQLISDPDVNNWYFFVPENWMVSESGGICMAYVPSASHASVSFSDFSAGGYTNVVDYWNGNFEHLCSVFGDVKVIEEGGDTTLATYAAKRYVYTGTYNGSTLKFMQVFLYANSAIYAFTYSADEDVYDTYYTYVEAILTNFKFRGQTE